MGITAKNDLIVRKKSKAQISDIRNKFVLTDTSHLISVVFYDNVMKQIN
jgi:hypothetical protein